MPVAPSVQEFLRRADVAYSVVPHWRAYTAADDAVVTDVPRPNWAKVVACFADFEPVQVVVPADCRVDLARLARATGSRSTRLATKDELKWLYPDCELGAVPPLGPLYRQRMFVDPFLEDQDVYFNAGSHGDAISMRFVDFANMTHPIIAHVAMPDVR